MARSLSSVLDLPLEIESYALEPLERAVSSGFTRRTTVVRLRGAGEEGLGEDVTYDGEDQLSFQKEGGRLPLAGSFTLASFSKRLAELDLFPSGPSMPAFRDYRRWGFESAALDLALRQAGQSLAGILERETAPVTFVVSLRLSEPPTTAPVRRLLERDPGLRFKVDPTTSWDEGLIAELAALASVDTLDLKGAYRGTVVDQPPDPGLYARVAEAFPAAWIEDPGLTPETESVLAAHRERISWDAPIHSVSDIQALASRPGAINVKPSRFGSLEALAATYDYCAERGIPVYGGGQFELGPGRGQIQYLASLFHPDAPNDVAPGGYNDPTPREGLPTSPMEPRAEAIGFRWG
ncbi:MAG: hypothetical protein M3123_05060 [Actinomycetota bacterium]|nr:hypothetical protein [Actinomycetota bacterium]